MSDTKLHPGKIFSLASSYWQPCTLHTAVKLEIFTVIGDKLLLFQDIVDITGASSRGLFALLNALVAMDLLEKDAGRFKNTPLSRTYLDHSSEKYVGHIVMHHHHMVDGWAKLDQAIEKGQPVKKRDYGEEKERESFLMGMFNLAMALAPVFSKEIDLKNHNRLLDIGGGPGTHAIHFCLANPQLKATVFDLATTQPFAEKTAKKFGVQGRVDFFPGDFNYDQLPGGYDVAWLSQVLHSNTPEQCQNLIRKIILSLKPGSLFLVHDFLLNDSLDGPLFPALFSLNMLVNNNGQSYSESEISVMMKKAGIKNIKRLPIKTPNDSGVLCGYTS
jgi:SAM-dependent methyltransferase